MLTPKMSISFIGPCRGALSHDEVERIVALTDRFSGADLKSLARSALARARRGRRTFTVSDILVELARETAALSEADRRRAMIYAAGRELVSKALDVKVGQGPEYPTLLDLQDQLALLMAGRVAEELALKSVSTLGEADLERATDLAEAIEIKYGMGTSGPLALRIVPHAWDLSLAVRQHIEKAVGRARHVLEAKLSDLQLDPAAADSGLERVVH